MPPARTRAAIARRLAGASAFMTTTALADVAQAHTWFGDLDAEHRSMITLVVRAGVDDFVQWFGGGASHLAPTNIFRSAPRALTRRISLHQTVDLIRTTVDSVERQVATSMPRGDRATLQAAVLNYAREIAFDAAKVYARAAEVRGAWDARLEALVMDAVIRGEADESVVSRASTLGWREPSGLCVVIGDLPDDPGAAEEMRSAAVSRGLDVLIAPQGDRLVVLLGGDFESDASAVGCTAVLAPWFGPGPVVVGPVVDSLREAVSSARSAVSGRRAAPAWPDAPRPVSADALLPERALAGDGHARRRLARDLYAPLADYGGDLLLTLETFLAQGASIEATARALFIHANTVRYRLGRITDLTGYSPTEPRDQYILRLAVTLGHLLG